MTTNRFALLQVLLISLLVLPVIVRADGVTLLIQDQNGNPIPDVVIELPDSAPPAIDFDKPAVLDQVAKRFKPELLIIQAGQQVNFPNSDNIRHHVYSFSTPKPFELKLYSSKPEKPLLFDQPGVVVLGCNIHDSMVGYIYVSKTMTVATDENGRAPLPNNELPNTIYLWHALQSTGPETRQSRNSDSPSDIHFNEQEKVHVLRLDITKDNPRNTFRDKFQTDGKQ